jgi:hypothetical protein
MKLHASNPERFIASMLCDLAYCLGHGLVGLMLYLISLSHRLSNLIRGDRLTTVAQIPECFVFSLLPHIAIIILLTGVARAIKAHKEADHVRIFDKYLEDTRMTIMSLRNVSSATHSESD